MKKLSAVFSILGAIGMIALVVLIVRFGSANMRRAEADSIQWRMEWASRR